MIFTIILNFNKNTIVYKFNNKIWKTINHSNKNIIIYCKKLKKLNSKKIVYVIYIDIIVIWIVIIRLKRINISIKWSKIISPIINWEKPSFIIKFYYFGLKFLTTASWIINI